MKRIIPIILIAIFFVSMTFAAAEATESLEGKVIGFSQVIYNNPFAKASQDYFVKEANAKGIKVIAADANLDMSKQIADVENFITQEIDMLVMMACDFEGSQAPVILANKAGIPVLAYICFSKAEEGVPLHLVTCDNFEIAKAQAEYFIKALPENAKIVYMALEPGQKHSIDRRDGFIKTLKAARSDVTVLAEQFSYSARDKGMAIMEDWLQRFPEIDAVITGNDESALGALQVLRAAGLAGKIMVSGIDATQEALDLIKAGEFTVSVMQPAKEIAKVGVDVAVKLLKGEEAPLVTNVPPVAISRDNIDQYIDYWK